MSSKHWTIRDDEEDVVHEGMLGQGFSSEVHKLRNTKSNADFARKIIRPFAGGLDIKDEVLAIKKLGKTGNPNIVQVREYGELLKDGAFFFIDMEICEVTLEAYLRGGVVVGDFEDWRLVKQQEYAVTRISYAIVRQIVKGLVFIHSLVEVHRDLSPQNGNKVLREVELKWAVLFKDGYWKIADFGLPSQPTSNRPVTDARPCYRAPEILMFKRLEYNDKADMWSLGCIAFELFSRGQKAFSHDFKVLQYTKVKRSSKYFIRQLHSVAKYYMQDLLERDPKRRPSSRELLVAKFDGDDPINPIQNGRKKAKRDEGDGRENKPLPGSAEPYSTRHRPRLRKSNRIGKV